MAATQSAVCLGIVYSTAQAVFAEGRKCDYKKRIANECSLCQTISYYHYKKI